MVEHLAKMGKALHLKKIRVYVYVYVCVFMRLGERGPFGYFPQLLPILFIDKGFSLYSMHRGSTS